MLKQVTRLVTGRRPLRIALAVAAMLSLSATAAAALYLSVPGMTGTSAAAGFPGQIVATSVSVSLSNAAGKPSLGSVVVTKNLDQTSPLLFEASGNGRNLGTVVVSMTRLTGGTTELLTAKYTLANARLSSFRITDPGSGVPSEQLTFVATAVTVEFTPVDAQNRAQPAISRTVTAVP